MDRVYQSNAIETPPSSVASSGSYPTAGNKASGQLATVPGPYWFYSITEEIRNAIIAAGLTPDSSQVNQLATALAKFLPLSGGNVTGNLTVQSKHIVRSVNGVNADASGNVAIEASAKFTVRATFTEECEYKGSVTRTISGLTPGSLICYKIEAAPDNQASATVLRLEWTGVIGTMGKGAGAWVEGTSVTVTLSNPSTTKAVKSILTVYTF